MTILEAVKNIEDNNYYLPAIQREFVWKPDQIEVLFDSLLGDYPIGSFLFWKVEGEKVKEFQFYEFIRNYHEKTTTHNPKANIAGKDCITAILDGQQRLTALYIGMKGTYAYKLPYKRWDNPGAFPKRKLHLNLLQESKEYGRKYDFKFLTPEEAGQNDDEKYWFEVGKVLDLREPADVNDYLIDNGLTSIGQEKSKFANRTLFKLQKAIHDAECINYYLQKGDDLDKVLNIFIRVNSGGTILSYSDLLLSIATAQWEKKDAREEITTLVDEMNNIGEGFDVSKDAVLKTCLVLCDFTGIAFKVDNFNRANMLDIERKWEEISQSIRLAMNLISDLGYNRDRLTSNSAIIPIAYYIMKKGNPNNFTKHSQYAADREMIRKWLACSLIKKVFSGQPDNVLRPIRTIIESNHTNFPLDKIIDKFRGTPNSIIFSADDIDNLFYYEYGQSYTYSILSMLYPAFDFSNKFHIDHMHPKSIFTEKKLKARGIPDAKIDAFMEEYNCLANLQLLEGVPNMEKLASDFKDWVKKTYPGDVPRKEYMKRHYVPDVDLDLANFEDFIKERKALMREEFTKQLSI